MAESPQSSRAREVVFLEWWDAEGFKYAPRASAKSIWDAALARSEIARPDYRPETREEVLALWNKIATEEMERVEQAFLNADSMPTNFLEIRDERAKVATILAFKELTEQAAIDAARSGRD